MFNVRFDARQQSNRKLQTSIEDEEQNLYWQAILFEPFWMWLTWRFNLHLGAVIFCTACRVSEVVLLVLIFSWIAINQDRCSLTFKFVVLMADVFSCYLHLSLCSQFHVLSECRKTMKISIQQKIMKSQYFIYFECKMFSRNLDSFDNLEFGPLFFFLTLPLSTTKIYATI